jgi:glutamyl-Q tRNA(Asp) synthetase
MFRTRFAPSPTGPLHLGHAYSALLAHDLARAAGGAFLLRMEDTDLDRCRPEWEAQIIDDLHWLGLAWDGPVQHQADRIAAYNARLEPLAARGLLYPCSCTRADIRAALSAPQEGVAFSVYPGTCRGRSMASRLPGDALRLNLAAACDALAGRVLSRKGEDIVAYFLASAFDDADQGITHVIRGADLFDFTAVQVILQQLFGLPTPTYHHHRLIRDENGKRLAKRDDARALSKYRAEGATPQGIRRMVGL